MIASWMIYGTVIAALLGLGALAAERVLLSLRMPTRFVWMASILLLFLMPFAPSPIPGGLFVTDIGTATGPIVASLAENQVTETSPARAASTYDWDSYLMLAWAFGSVFVIVTLFLSQVTLRREQRLWTRGVVEGVPVHLSQDLGPAVVGFFPGTVVLPSWVAQSGLEERSLLLKHEVEHVQARDPLLSLASLIALVLLPWNLALWWQVRRLRGAIEVDCDRRVLETHENARTYGSLLLDVASRHADLPFAHAAFVSPPKLLERRVRMMTRPIRPSLWATVACGGVAMGLLMVSCEMSSPTASDSAAELDAEGPVEIPLVGAVNSDTVPVSPGNLDSQPTLANVEEITELLVNSYPPELRDARQGGTVALSFVIETDGTVDSSTVKVISSDHELLTQAAREAITRFIFTPGQLDGADVRVFVEMPITWQPTV